MPYHESKLIKLTSFSVLPVQVQKRAGQGYQVPLWGCKIGAKEAGVVGGNEVIESLLSGDLLSSQAQGGTPIKSLPGMDIFALLLRKVFDKARCECLNTFFGSMPSRRSMLR